MLRSPAARGDLSVGEVVSALIASRLCSPSPLYDVAGWASGAAVPELLGIPPALLKMIGSGGRWRRSRSTPSVCAHRSRRGRSSGSGWLPAGCMSI